MPTLSGMRRRGYTSTAIRNFVAKCWGLEDERHYSVTAARILSAPKLESNCSPGDVCAETITRGYRKLSRTTSWKKWMRSTTPKIVPAGSRKIPFQRRFILRKMIFVKTRRSKFYRLSPGREVRLRYAYLITCKEVIKDSDGRVVELRCTYDPATRGGTTPDGRKVKSTIHWVSAAHALPAEVRLYDNLFLKEDPNEVAEGHDFTENLNPDSLQVLPDCKSRTECARRRAWDKISV